MNKKLTTVAVSLAVALMSGCGSSGGSSSNSNDNSTPTIKTGTFIDAPIKGVHYKTATQNGFTDAQGHFKYQDGESISFMLGTLSLGQGKAKAELTPYDIVDNNTTAGNIAALLQNFDANRSNANIIDLSKLKDHNFTAEHISIEVPSSELETKITQLLARSDFQQYVDTANNNLITVTAAKQIMDDYIQGTGTGSGEDGTHQNTPASISSEALAGYTVISEYKDGAKVFNIKKVSYIFLAGEKAIVVIDLFDGSRKVLRADLYHHDDGNHAVIMPGDYTWDNGDAISLFAADIETDNGYDKITVGHSNALPYTVTAIVSNSDNGIDETSVSATDASSTTSGSTTSTTNSAAPTVPDNVNIAIYNNLNADNFGGSSHLGAHVLPVDTAIHCTDYGFTSVGTEHTNTTLGIHTITYSKGQYSCMESDYASGGAHGSKSYVTY